MKINHQQHIRLIDDEITYQNNEFLQLLNKQAVKMFAENKLYTCEYIGYDDARGNAIVKFKHNVCRPPRKNECLLCFLSSYQNSNKNTWGGLTYKDLRSKLEAKFEATTIFFNYQNEETIVGLSGISESNLNKYKKGDLLFLAPNDPPIEYLQNMREILLNISVDEQPYLNTEIDIQNQYWQPIPLAVNEQTFQKFDNDFSTQDTIIIQGPPGTGKTYLMAKLCAEILKSNKRVLVTALTNRALIELAEKDSLQIALSKGEVYKTALKADEQKNKKIKGLKSIKIKDLQNKAPKLLLSTYYVMSKLAKNTVNKDFFDYVIIEEASQAFLATLVIAKKLGLKIIIIGDINQLEPIYHKTFNDNDVYQRGFMVKGLKNLSYFYKQAKKYILTDTYRLTEASVKATNTFYDGMLNSKSDKVLPHKFDQFDLLKNFFDANGGVSLYKLKLNDSKTPSSKELKLINDIIYQLFEWNPLIKVAVLSFYRYTVRCLQSDIYSQHKKEDQILVETVDRIQGLTTNFTIFYIPKQSIPFALDKNRFNVATSRATHGTLIVTDEDINHFIKLTPEMINFFNSVRNKQDKKQILYPLV